MTLKMVPMGFRIGFLTVVVFAPLRIFPGIGFAQPLYAGDVSAVGSQSDSANAQDSLPIAKQLGNLRLLQADLHSGRPTLAFFYHSVACSCTAARCNIAAAAIDSIPELTQQNDSLNYKEVDAYLLPEAESLFSVTIVPAIIYFDEEGREINRLEWGTSREAIRMLIQHPDLKQAPLD